ncbi:MAG: hypothetical protein H0V66_08175 [Bdellovibrionales bacterium]|nr:hypothetical protein [Bdellovibrionales bacterium]
MSLPIYQHINVRTIQLEDLKNFLNRDMNSKHPVAINLKHLDLDQQREMIGLIENFFSTNNLSFKFPYPVYLVMDQEKTITQMPTVKMLEELPRLFNQKETKMNVKESHLLGRNKLLQQEIRNADAEVTQGAIQNYGTIHRKVFELEKERLFYRSILNRLVKASKNG